jgi:hypothetical protein
VGSFAHLKEQAEGKRSRQRLIDALTDLITRQDSPVDADTLREIRACWLYFAEGKKIVDRIDFNLLGQAGTAQSRTALRNHCRS